MTGIEKSAQGITVVYDGQCPFCQSYVKLMALRQRTGAVRLIDARSDDACVRELQRRGYDLNEGMAAIYGSTVYYGSDALALISTLAESNSGLARKALARLFAHPERARRLYPALKQGRRLALRLLGRADIKAPGS